MSNSAEPRFRRQASAYPGYRMHVSDQERRNTLRIRRSGMPIAARIREVDMPEKEVLERAQKDAREGKSPSTQAGEFVHEEIEHVKEGKHGARSTKQAIAIGLSKARRAGVDLPPPKAGSVSAKTRKQISRDSAKGKGEPTQRVSAERSRSATAALQREPNDAASHEALSRQARSSAKQRSSASRKNSAQKAVRTKGEAGLRSASQKAARTRASHQ